MSTNTSKRLFALIAAFLLFVAYLMVRDTVQVECSLSRKEVKQIVSHIQEWSAPKFFRHIEIQEGEDGTVLATVREPGEHLSVTVFSNTPSGWNKVGWYLLAANHNVIK